MHRESESMKELHKIREEIYEETKHMTVAEKIAYINKEADEVEKKYGLHLRKAAHAHK
jgi:hypothetical protein